MKLTLLVDYKQAVGEYLDIKGKLPIDSFLVCNREYAERLKEIDSQLPLYIFENSSDDYKDLGIPTRQGAYGLPSPTVSIVVFSEIDLIRVLAVGGMKTIFLRKYPMGKEGYDTQRVILTQMLNMISDYDDIDYLIVETTSLSEMAMLKGIGVEHFLISPDLCNAILGDARL